MGRKVFIINAVLAIVFMAGCRWIPRVKYTRQVNLTIPAGQAELFTAKTHNGGINIRGSQTTDCNLTATIIARAYTEENAKKTAEQVKIDLVPEGNSINVRIEKPDIPKWVQISVSLDANLPQIMNLSLGTHNGSIHCSNITGWLKADSHNGNIIVADVSGDADLSTHNGKISSSSIVGRIKAVTHNGKITVTGAVGGADLLTHNGIINYAGALADLKFESHNGNVDIHCTEQSPKPCDISIETHNGSIEFTAPENFSAAVDGSTHNGSIRTDLPLTVTGKNNKIIKGVMGSGRDKLHLKTHNGSIKIK